MKKLLCTSLVLFLILSGVTAAFAAEANKDATVAANTESSTPKATDAAVTTGTDSGTTGAAVTIIPDMTFSGDPIKLSLDEAYKKMEADSPQAEVAALNKEKDMGIAKGYSEKVSLLNKSEKAGGDYSTTDKNILNIQKEYAATQAAKNFDSEIKQLRSDTMKNYYTLKELENQVQIAKDNLALKEKLLSNTQLKFKLGTVAKTDLLQAEISVNEAKDQLLAAQNGLSTSKMGFNQFMGYGLMQNVTLTDTIKEVAMPKKSLTDTIKDALNNRNEILDAEYKLKVSTLYLDNYKAYPKSSSKYTDAKMSMLLAETNMKNAPLTVESDVRTKYMAVNEKYSAVQTGKKTVENAKETERLAQLQYDAGMATLSDVEGAQLAYYKAQIAYSKDLLEYNLAVYAYELAGTVGTKQVEL
ncbi:MAG: TolC family protein [Bacillota bacterium]|jgi:hypothetical protein|nr:TolC family protein [Bacillota bacterium]